MSARVLRSISELADIAGPVVIAAGVFDGFHLGHRAVIDRAIAGARAAGGTPVVATFDPHPAAVLRPGSAPPLLTSTRHKIRLLADAGIAHVLVLGFDAAFAAQPPEIFIQALADACRPLREICVGEDWAFGKDRAGNLSLLTVLGKKLGFTATGHLPVIVDGKAVSSTAIRAAVESGALAEAARLLGREFSVLGTVIEGRRLGRTLGFPTANVRPESEQLPPNGVYAVRAHAAADQTRNAERGTRKEKISPPPAVVGYRGIANIGIRPTVADGGTQRLVEVHLFDFTGDLYGRDIEVFFGRFVRPEQKFPGLDALRAQIASDVAVVRAATSA
ncbi:MAG: bifunctional riboflavin kinase/FAD synthetase [Verrucomicrobia bacterium]|nr:bifunctional riboflavin kinase/FAD synthetase [Verrucomicrobiota bacterium]